jgi:hypothetical protein
MPQQKQDSNFFINIGDEYHLAGEYDKAIEQYKKAISIEPAYSFAYISIIAPLVRKKDFIAARDYLNLYKSKRLASHIDFEEWSFFQNYLTAATENIPNKAYDLALKNLNIALQKYGTVIKHASKSAYIDILTLKAYVLEKLNKVDEAKDAYNQTYAVNKNQPDVEEGLQRLKSSQILVKQSDNIPPVIELISPRASRGFNIVSATSETQIVGRAKDASGITLLKINGKAVQAEEDGLFVTTLSLNAGANAITIAATDKAGNSSTKTFTVAGNVMAKKEEEPVAVEIIPVSTSASPAFHAILIGEEQYDDPSIADLENPVRDASELKSILEEKYTFNRKNIETLFNKSREEIMQGIVQKCNSLSENDNLLIFYAGHGTAEKDKFGEVDGYWIPSSAKKGVTSTYISSDDINKALKRSNSRHILVIADACFSGAFTRSLSSDASIGIQKQYSVPSRKIMASGNMEPVPDKSRFVYYLTRNLKENKEKYITAKKLYDSFYEAILNNSDTSPQYAPIKNVGDEGGEFVFIKK